jgi:hypothetical protein
VDVLLIRSKFSTTTCFGIWLPSSEGRECLISYSSHVLCYGRMRIMARTVWPVVVSTTNYLLNCRKLKLAVLVLLSVI